jgi:hypothetical protein
MCLCVPPWGSSKDAAKDCEFCDATGEIVIKEQPVDMHALAEKAALEENVVANENREPSSLARAVFAACDPKANRELAAKAVAQAVVDMAAPPRVRVTVTAAELQPGDVILSIGGLSSRVLGVNQRPRYVEVETEFGNGGRGLGLHPKGERVLVERAQH